MKKVLYFSFVFFFALLLVGCGDSKEEAKSHDKYNNAVECTYDENGSISKLIVYLDNDDKATSFDWTMTGSAEGITEEMIKMVEDTVCSGQGEFKKEWLDECSYQLKGDVVESHVYVNSGEWLGEYGTKDALLNADFSGTDLEGHKCVVK